MPSTISDVMSALEQLLLAHFKSINSGTATQPFLAFEVGMPISDAALRNPADTTKYSSALALEFLSHRANTVPSIEERLFVETSNTVDGLYEILLRGSNPVNAANMELLGAIKRTALAAFEDVLQAEGGVSEPFHPTHGDPEDWYDQANTGNWTSLHVDRADNPITPTALASAPAPVYSKRLLQWNLAPMEFRSELNKPAAEVPLSTLVAMRAAPLAAATPFRPAPALQLAKMSLAMTVAPVARTTRAAQFNPAVFASSRSPIQRKVVLTQEGRRLADETVSTPPPATPPPTPQPAVSSDAFTINVDISIIKLRRPWLSDGLLNLGGWFVPSAAKGSFSDGTGATGTGHLPVLPVACVLIRNLSVHAQWSESDQNNIENSTHLGAFGLQGRTYDRNSATLTVPGMQIVAWICDPLPVLPPADAPPA